MLVITANITPNPQSLQLSVSKEVDIKSKNLIRGISVLKLITLITLVYITNSAIQYTSEVALC